MKQKFPNAWKIGRKLSILILGLASVLSLFRGCSLERKKETSAAASLSRAAVRKLIPPICGNAENFRLYGIGDSVCVRKQKDCLSGAVYVPFNEKFLLDSLNGETKVCFWLNGRCARVKTIRKGENLDWESNLPAYSAMRFWGEPGTVKVEVVSY